LFTTGKWKGEMTVDDEEVIYQVMKGGLTNLA
jgi:hypothetical protein